MMIQYILDRHICILDSNKQKLCLYKQDIDIIKNFEGFKILDDGSYWYKGHSITVLDEENNNAKCVLHNEIKSEGK